MTIQNAKRISLPLLFPPPPCGRGRKCGRFTSLQRREGNTVDFSPAVILLQKIRVILIIENKFCFLLQGSSSNELPCPHLSGKITAGEIKKGDRTRKLVLLSILVFCLHFVLYF